MAELEVGWILYMMFYKTSMKYYVANKYQLRH